jgi:hypothetical protein
MLESVRRHTSLLVAVGAIAILAASQVAAQEGATKPGVEQGATGPAGINADTVDGRHAKGAAATPTERAGQLVATNAQGYLPADILRKAQDADRLDGVDSSAFPRVWALKSDDGAVNEADNPVHWRQLKGVPAGFADGKDNVGSVFGAYAGERVDGELEAKTGTAVIVRCDTGDLAISASYGFDPILIQIEQIGGTIPMSEAFVVSLQNHETLTASYFVRAICLDMTP